MLFPTIDFAIFFLVVFLVHWLLSPFRVPWKLFMIGASYVFYAWWDVDFVWLLAGFSVITQVGALAVRASRDKPQQMWVLGGALVAAFAPLIWFKYYVFTAVNLSTVAGWFGGGEPIPLLQIVLPIGISFYTFMGVSYIIDIHRKKLEPASWIDLFLYLSFFPHLVAGPIVRSNELIPQFRAAKDPRRIDVSMAAYLIFAGLFKKVVISSYLATSIVDPVFADPGGHTAPELLIAVYGYAVQIYADFSGYTDIAIGIALLLGFKFPQNFDRPYAAVSLQDFWRRWHITLSRWLRDYLYIPLGGNRLGEKRTYVNIMLTMLLGGLWHGAAWTFVIWGGIHGAGQVVGHYRRTHGLEKPAETTGQRIAKQVITFNLVCLGWVFFRSESLGVAWSVLTGLLTRWGSAPLVTLPVIAAIVIGIGMQYLPHGPSDRIRTVFSRMAPAVQGIVMALALLVITTLGPQGVAPFIYFQF
ncbi:MAG: MBOAT family protein [Actinomycetota bacterium]